MLLKTWIYFILNDIRIKKFTFNKVNTLLLIVVNFGMYLEVIIDRLVSRCFICSSFILNDAYNCEHFINHFIKHCECSIPIANKIK